MKNSPAVVSWSSGKDSAWALLEARKSGLDVVGLLTTITEPYERVSMHGVRLSLLAAQVERLGLPLYTVGLPAPCTNDIYQELMATVLSELRSKGIGRVVFGDLFLEDVREYREEQMQHSGLEPVFPLWHRPTPVLAREMIAGGLEAILTTVDPEQLDSSFAGRRYDHALLNDLPQEIDPCGERGEFHTVVTNGPMFSSPIPVTIGQTVTREGFVYTDVYSGAEMQEK